MFWNTCYGQGDNQLLLFPPVGLKPGTQLMGIVYQVTCKSPWTKSPASPLWEIRGVLLGSGRVALPVEMVRNNSLGPRPLALGPWAPASAFPSQMVVPCPVLGILSPLLPIWDVNSQ